MCEIIIIRHGNSLSNVDGTFTGQIDAPLSEVGIAQAKIACNYLLENYKVDKIYSSDLSRAIDTVKPLAEKLNLEILTDSSLREMYGGEWEGLKMSEIAIKFSEDYSVWQNNVGFSRCTGGESYAEVCKRAKLAIEKIAFENSDKCVVVSTHGGFIRGLECAIKGVPLENMAEIPYVANASISIIKVKDGKLIYEKSNINDYLGVLQTQMPKGI